MKRLAASKYYAVKRKEAKYIAKPLPGRHTLLTSVTLLSLLRDKLGLVKTSKEADKAIKQGKIEVNGKVVKEPKAAVGFGDILHVLPTDEYYLVGVNRQGAVSLEKTTKDAKRVLKVVGKYVAKKGKVMLRLHDGTTLQGNANVNDSVVLANGKIEQVIKFQPGAKCIVYKGRHSSKQGVVKNIIPGSAQRKPEVELETPEGLVRTLVDNVIAVGA